MTTSRSPFRKILVATDFSKHSAAALVRGMWLGERSHGEVVVAHVLTNFRQAVSAMPYSLQWELLYGDMEKFQRGLRTNSQNRLLQFVKPYVNQNVQIKTETLLGKADIALTHAVQCEGYEMVVLGTQGRSALQRFFLGSTALRVIHHCPATVWVAKEGCGWPLTRLLVPMDFSPVSRRSLEQASWLAAQSQAQVDLLHVVELDDVSADLDTPAHAAHEDSEIRRRIEDQARQRMEEWSAEAGLLPGQISMSVAWGKPWQIIGECCRRFNSSLVVLGTVGRSGVEGLLLGNTAEKVLKTCDCSVLAVKPADFVSPVDTPVWPLHPTDEPHSIT
jgi:universal stress protein E